MALSQYKDKTLERQQTDLEELPPYLFTCQSTKVATIAVLVKICMCIYYVRTLVGTMV